MSEEPDFFDHRYGRFGPARVAEERAAWRAEEEQRRQQRVEDDKCSGGGCVDILRLCSKHSAQYQRRYGRASNE